MPMAAYRSEQLDDLRLAHLTPVGRKHVQALLAERPRKTREEESMANNQLKSDDQDQGRDQPSIAELIESLDWSSFILDGLNEVRQAPWPEQRFDQNDRLTQAMVGLTEVERLVIEQRFGLTDGRARSAEEISAVSGLSPERVSVIERTALAKIRQVKVGEEEM
jgi:RNA polymerase sigma factor (sigma-70 family)